MTDNQPPSDLALVRALDRIRDETLDMQSMCRRFADLLQGELGLLEAHVLVRNPDTGALDNPAPDRPLGSELQIALREGDAAGWKQPLERNDVQVRPLRVRGRLLGVLAARLGRHQEPQTAARTDLALSIIDSAVEHALALRDLTERNRELEAIYDLDRTRDRHLPFDQMVDHVANKLLDYIRADGAAVVLYNELTETVDIRLPTSRDLPRLHQPGALETLRDLAFRAFQMRDLVSAEQLHPAIGSVLCVPLILEEAIIGAFLVVRQQREPFSHAERQLLAAMSSQIDTAIFEDLQRQRIKSVFGRYVSRRVVDQMLQSGQDFFEGQRRTMSVLFSDLRGFTSTSERLDTDTVVRMLNEHLSAMTEVVLEHNGTLDKFIGDCVMAFWNAPVDQPYHAWQAVCTAVQMRAAHEKLLGEWKRRGLEPIHIGIGINTGEMFVGNIGDERKSSYTVIGDHVNLASRLEGVAAGGQILITERTLAPIRDRVRVEELEPVRVKGKSMVIPVYNVQELLSS